MKIQVLVATTIALLNGCSRPSLPDDSLVDLPDNVVSRSIAKPTLPDLPAKLTCVSGGEPLHQSSLFRRGLLVPGSSTTSGAPATGVVTSNLSIDDQPPGGGDGSFRLFLGREGREMGDGSFATHSHREPHLLWIVDMPEENKATYTYKMRKILLEDNAKIDIQLEYVVPGGFVKRGTVTMEQTDVPTFYDKIKDRHKLNCVLDENYAWRVTTKNVRIGSRADGHGLTIEARDRSPRAMAIRMSSMVISSSKYPNKTKVIPFASGCASFQICGNWNACQSIVPPCPSAAFAGEPAEVESLAK